LLPRVWTDLAGMQIVETVTWRLIGAALIAFAVSSWLASKEAVWTRVRTLVVMEAVWSVVAAATITWGLLVEGLAPLEWLNVAILAGFAVAFTRYLAVFEVGGPDIDDCRVAERDPSDVD
ncbi:MAG: hypothetical protein R3324_02965, partial [Halobacteriales archaeon]|nr:hypothetical protein [Halobacteriales archaeon]